MQRKLDRARKQQRSKMKLPGLEATIGGQPMPEKLLDPATYQAAAIQQQDYSMDDDDDRGERGGYRDRDRDRDRDSYRDRRDRDDD